MRVPVIGSIGCARVSMLFFGHSVSLAGACPAAEQLRRDGVESLRLVGLQEQPRIIVSHFIRVLERLQKTKIVPHSPDDMSTG